jgi:N-acetylglucosaminyldiphosphoundecaprenol N-acetyl-beta-D-mannosaminyltransferase
MSHQALVTIPLLGTPLVITDYESLLDTVVDWAAQPGVVAVEFCNTQVVAMRRTEPSFHEATSAYDYFIPDGMPLIWCLRAMGAKLRDRVYGPTFLRHAISHDRKLKHYFLGGSALTSQKLIEKSQELSGGKFQVVGGNSSYSKPEDSAAILEEINRLSPDVIWVGLGTPKQQQWIHDNKAKLKRGVVLTVGFAFDVNAGTKLDAPMWMQRLGLTWLFRISQEPKRLLGRYLKYNTWFVLLCVRDLLRHLTRTTRPD